MMGAPETTGGRLGTEEFGGCFVKTVTDQAGLDAAIDGRPAVVLFHATWCPYCRTFRPEFEQATENGKFAVVEAVLDDYDNPLWATFDIDIVPTVIFFDGGKPGRRLDGVPGFGLSPNALRSALE
jgi:thioredoxin 1